MKSDFKFFKKRKSLPVDQFLQNVLYDKKFGYYSTKIPFGETQAITSNKNNVSIFLRTEKKEVPRIIPIKAPWNDIPPSQIFKISIGLLR